MTARQDDTQSKAIKHKSQSSVRLAVLIQHLLQAICIHEFKARRSVHVAKAIYTQIPTDALELHHVRYNQLGDPTQ